MLPQSDVIPSVPVPTSRISKLKSWSFKIEYYLSNINIYIVGKTKTRIWASTNRTPTTYTSKSLVFHCRSKTRKLNTHLSFCGPAPEFVVPEQTGTIFI